MKILHLMTDEKFTNGIIRYYNHFFNNGEHEICVICGPNPEYFRLQDGWTIKVFRLEPSFFSIKSIGNIKNQLILFKEYDAIILHSFNAYSNVMLLVPSRKLVWIEWGADLYYQNKRKGVKARILNRYKQFAQSRIGTFVAIFPPDVDCYKKKYPKSNAQIFYAPYTSLIEPDAYFTQYDSLSQLKKTRTAKETVYIMVGHNGARQLNHLETLDILSKYRNEDIKVVLSLSYGSDKKYTDEVEQKAKKIFGDKAIVLKNYMPKDEYYRLIERIDIVIFNTVRQTGLGNLYRMAFRNVKIYMKPECTMFQYFSKNGIPVQDIGLLQKQSFIDFCLPIQNNRVDKMLAFFIDVNDVQKNRKRWEMIFESLRREKNNC